MTKTHLSWRIQNAAANEVDVDIFDTIGDPYEGVTGADFAKELRALKNVSRINLHINSPGGYVQDGLQMYAAIKQHKAQVVAYVESQAASAASFVAMAADKVAIFPQAKLVIHDAHGLAIGNAKDMRSLAELMDEESNNIASIYAEKSGQSREHWREAMQANEGIGSTYRGEEAVSAGLADEVVSTARNFDPERIAAYAGAVRPDPDELPAFTHSKSDEGSAALPGAGIVLPADLGAQFRESASYTPAPTLEELLIKQAAKERISTGAGATGGT